MIIGIVGRSIDPQGNMCSQGTGKDTVADCLVDEFNCVKVALADEMKRFLLKLGFTREQLWGPSQFRNTLHPDGICTARHALRTLGTEWGRDMISRKLWTNHTVRQAQKLLTESDGRMYLPEEGIVPTLARVNGMLYIKVTAPQKPYSGVVITDVRFKEEIDGIKAAKGKVMLVQRRIDALPEGVDIEHESESDLNEYDASDRIWDEVLSNDGTLDDLRSLVRCLVGSRTFLPLFPGLSTQ